MPMYLNIQLGCYELADGGYTPHFMIIEHDGLNTRTIPFDCQEKAKTEKEAIDIAKSQAFAHINDTYPGNTKFRILDDR